MVYLLYHIRLARWLGVNVVIVKVTMAAVTMAALICTGCHLIYPFDTSRAAANDAALDARDDASRPDLIDLIDLSNREVGEATDAPLSDLRAPDAAPQPDAPLSPCLNAALFSTKWVCAGGGGQCYATCYTYTLDCYAAPTACTCSGPGIKFKSCPAVTGTGCDRCATSLANGCCAP